MIIYPKQIPSSSFPVKELFGGSQSFSSLGVGTSHTSFQLDRTEEEKRDLKEEIALIVFWQALVPTGSDTFFSYGHHTITVPLPQSMSALREVESMCL